MAGQELTRDEVFALAGAFSRVDSAKTLLSVAGFPSWAVPETGYRNAREFWTKVSDELAAGVMADGRIRILEAARDWFRFNEQLAALAAAAALPRTPPASAAAPGTDGPTVSAADSAGTQVGSNNVQINIFGHGTTPEQDTPQAGG